MWKHYVVGIYMKIISPSSVLVRITIAMMKHHGQKQVGEERVSLTHTSISYSISEGHQGKNSSSSKTWKHELMQRQWRGAADWLAHRGLFSLLSYSTQDHQPRCGLPTMSWHLPHQSSFFFFLNTFFKKNILFIYVYEYIVTVFRHTLRGHRIWL